MKSFTMDNYYQKKKQMCGHRKSKLQGILEGGNFRSEKSAFFSIIIAVADEIMIQIPYTIICS